MSETWSITYTQRYIQCYQTETYKNIIHSFCSFLYTQIIIELERALNVSRRGLSAAVRLVISLQSQGDASLERSCGMTLSDDQLTIKAPSSSVSNRESVHVPLKRLRGVKKAKPTTFTKITVSQHVTPSPLPTLVVPKKLSIDLAATSTKKEELSIPVASPTPSSDEVDIHKIEVIEDSGTSEPIRSLSLGSMTRDAFDDEFVNGPSLLPSTTQHHRHGQHGNGNGATLMGEVLPSSPSSIHSVDDDVFGFGAPLYCDPPTQISYLPPPVPSVRCDSLTITPADSLDDSLSNGSHSWPIIDSFWELPALDSSRSSSGASISSESSTVMTSQEDVSQPYQSQASSQSSQQQSFSSFELLGTDVMDMLSQESLDWDVSALPLPLPSHVHVTAAVAPIAAAAPLAVPVPGAPRVVQAFGIPAVPLVASAAPIAVSPDDDHHYDNHEVVDVKSSSLLSLSSSSSHNDVLPTIMRQPSPLLQAAANQQQQYLQQSLLALQRILPDMLCNTTLSRDILIARASVIVRSWHAHPASQRSLRAAHTIAAASIYHALRVLEHHHTQGEVARATCVAQSALQKCAKDMTTANLHGL
jgi:hypothetical protein